MAAAASTRTRLVAAAARLFRARGYHGVGLIELLEEARAPKGSMYHAFPAGKAGLALAAADRAMTEVLTRIAAAFDPARDWADGLRRYCEALAEGFEAGETSCPVGPLLFDAPENGAFRARLAALHGRWTRALAYHAIRFGAGEDEAEARAEWLLVALQGAWVLARARGDAALLRSLPGRLG